VAPIGQQNQSGQEKLVVLRETTVLKVLNLVLAGKLDLHMHAL
jgi:hypothetical protein